MEQAAQEGPVSRQARQPAGAGTRFWRRTVCGVDLGGSALRLAVAEQRRGAPTVHKLVTLPRAPDRSLAAQVADAFRTCTPVPHEVHVAVAGEWATYRTLTFPLRGGRALDAAVPPALTALLPFASGDGLVAHEAIGAGAALGTTVCAAFGRREEITALIDALAAAECPVESVLPGPLAALRVATAALREEPEVVFLDVAPAAPTLAILRLGRPCVIRVLRPPTSPPTSPAPSVDLSHTIEELRWTLAVAARTSHPPVVVGGSAEVAGAIAALARERMRLPVRLLLDLPIAGVPEELRPRQGEYAAALGLALGTFDGGGRARRGFEAGGASPRALAARALRREVRRTRLIAAVVLGLLTAHGALDYAAARRRLGQAERAMHASLAAVSRPGDSVGSVKDLRERVTALERRCASEGCVRPLDLLERLSRAIPADLDIVIESIELDGRSALVEGRAGNVAVVDQLRAALAPFGDAVVAAAVEPRSARGDVRFRLEASAMPGNAAPAHPPLGGALKAVDA
jgi:hypothetical protein